MNADKLNHRYEQLGKAIEKLGEIVGDMHDDRDRDAMIQRFEFTIELYWKSLKVMLEKEKIDARSPAQVFKEAYGLGWLGDDQKIWSDMLEDRNLSSHTYNEDLAKEIAARIETYYPYLDETYKSLKQHLD